MNLKRKPPTVRQNNAKKPRPCDKKTAANALLLLSNSRNDVGKTNAEILAAETLLSFVDVASTNREPTVGSEPDAISAVCKNENLPDEVCINVEREKLDEGNGKKETSTIRSTQVIYSNLFMQNTHSSYDTFANRMVNANCLIVRLFS